MNFARACPAHMDHHHIRAEETKLFQSLNIADPRGKPRSHDLVSRFRRMHHNGHAVLVGESANTAAKIIRASGEDTESEPSSDTPIMRVIVSNDRLLRPLQRFGQC